MRCDRVWKNARLATMAEGKPGLGIVEKGLIAAHQGRIAYAGPEDGAPALDATETIDCAGRWITPGLVDCHTHIVHGGNRAHEFELRLAGATYEELAKAGGGIVSTMKATREASEDALVASAPAARRYADGGGRDHARDQVGLWPGARERDEDSCGRLAASARSARSPSPRAFSAPTPCRPRPRATRMPIFRWFCDDMLPAVAKAGLADCIDAFCGQYWLHAGADQARVRHGQGARPAGQAAMPSSSPTSMVPCWRHSTARNRPIIWSRSTRQACRRSPRPAPSRCCCPAPSISCARRTSRRST